MEDLNKNISELMDGVQSFIQARNFALAGNIAGAREEVQRSDIPKDSKAKLLKALDSNNSHTIEVVFNDYALGLGQAFCESCHGR